MSANSLVAFCVACLFLLALATVTLSFIERRPSRRKDPAERVTETQEWPGPKPD